MTKSPSWSEELCSLSPGSAGYNTHILFSSHEQSSPASSWSGNGKVLTGDTSSLPAPVSGLLLCPLLCFLLILLALLKSQRLHNWLLYQLIFLQWHLWFFPILLSTASLPNLRQYQASSKKNSLPNSKLQMQAVATTDSVPTERTTASQKGIM